jgi:hypothetical protein
MKTTAALLVRDETDMGDGERHGPNTGPRLFAISYSPTHPAWQRPSPAVLGTAHLAARARGLRPESQRGHGTYSFICYLLIITY